MNTFRLLVFFTISFLYHNSGFASVSPDFCGSDAIEKNGVACSVTNFNVTAASNLCNGELLTLNFTFTGVDFGLNGYTVVSPHDGNFTYQLGDPQSFMAIALCDANVTFTIYDNDNPNCSATFNYGQVCCDCQYTIDIIQSSCVDGSFSTIIDYQYTSGSCTNHNPLLFINGISFLIQYDAGLYYTLPIYLTSNYLTYVFDTGVPGLNETYTEILPNPCYSIIQFFDVTIDTLNCSNDMMSIPFTVNEGFGLNGYIISDNFGNAQYFTYNDPREYFILADCYTNVSLTITDLVDPSNTMTITFDEPLCCPCQYEVDVQLSQCMNGVIDISFNFNNLSGSCVNYNWNLFINNDSLVLDHYNGTYFFNGYQSNDSLLYLKICSQTPNSNDCYLDTLANPCFIPINTSPCTLTAFNATPDTSTCTGEVIGLNFGFTGTNFGTNGYTLSTNTGFSQSYSLTDTTLLTLIADCDSTIVITIRDVTDSLCAMVDTVGLLCCPCIPDISISQSACINDSFTSSIMINNVQGSCINYDWALTINGQNYALDTTNTGYSLLVSNTSDSLLLYEFCSLVPGLSECFRDTLVNPCYQPVSTTQCSINNFWVAADSTTCTGEVISLNFGFFGTDFGTNGYNISTNTGFSQFYNLSDSTLFTLIADCNENIIIKLTDASDPLCTAVDTIGLLCCPCMVDMALSSEMCVDGTSSAIITINDMEGSCINVDWTLDVNGQNHNLNPNNTGFFVQGISSLDSLLVYNLCYEIAGLKDCETYTLENPCFISTVNTLDIKMEDILDINFLPGQHITLTNKSTTIIKIYLYAVDGSILVVNLPILPNTERNVNVSNWPSGTYILKASNQINTFTKKLINVR